MNELKTDLRRALLSPPFWIAAALMTAAVALGAGSKMLFPEDAAQGLYTGYHIDLIQTGLSSSVALMVLPILCTLPYTAAFLEEYQSGYIKVYLMKCDERRYVRGKVIAPMLAGGLCLTAGVLLAYTAAALIYTPMELAGDMPSAWSALFGPCLRYMVCGALWAGVGALLANVSLSRYMAYASPFVLFYVLVVLAERYFTGLVVLNPKEWIVMSAGWPLGTWGVALLALAMIGILGMANEAVIEGKIKN